MIRDVPLTSRNRHRVKWKNRKTRFVLFNLPPLSLRLSNYIPTSLEGVRKICNAARSSAENRLTECRRYRPWLAQQVAAANSANQQDSPKPTVVALESARRGVLASRVRTRRPRVSPGDRDARADRRRRGSDRPASGSPAVERGTGPGRIDARSTRNRTSHSREPRPEPQPNHHGRRCYRFSLSSSSRTRRNRAIAIAESPRPSYLGGRVIGASGLSRAIANRSREKPHGRRSHSRATRLSDADGGFALPTPSRDTEPHR